MATPGVEALAGDHGRSRPGGGGTNAAGVEALALLAACVGDGTACSVCDCMESVTIRSQYAIAMHRCQAF